MYVRAYIYLLLCKDTHIRVFVNCKFSLIMPVLICQLAAEEFSSLNCCCCANE